MREGSRVIRICLLVFLTFGLAVGCAGVGRDDVRNGAALYAQNCALCHGGDAKGGGGAGVYGLSKTPPDLTGLRARNGGAFPVYETLATLEGYANGGLRGRQMAGFTGLQGTRKKRIRIDRARIRTTEPLAGLLAYLETLQSP